MYMIKYSDFMVIVESWKANFCKMCPFHSQILKNLIEYCLKNHPIKGTKYVPWMPKTWYGYDHACQFYSNSRTLLQFKYLPQLEYSRCDNALNLKCFLLLTHLKKHFAFI